MPGKKIIGISNKKNRDFPLHLLHFLCIFAPKKGKSMEFIVTFFSIYALFFLLLFAGAFALYLFRSGITLAAAICIGFTRSTEFFLGNKNARNSSRSIPVAVFISIYIALIALISNVW